MEKLNAIETSFFGRNLDFDVGIVIVTNIKSIYLNIIKNSKIINQGAGFYKNSFVELNKKNYLLVKITPGNVIIDVLKILSNRFKNIMLIGLGGSLNNKYLVGDVVFPNLVMDCLNMGDVIKICNVGSHGTICQVDGLIQEDCFYDFLLANNVDFVDMESFIFAKFCKENNINSKIISIISDAPLTSPFFKNNKFLENNLDKIVKKIIDKNL